MIWHGSKKGSGTVAGDDPDQPPVGARCFAQRYLTPFSETGRFLATLASLALDPKLLWRNIMSLTPFIFVQNGPFVKRFIFRALGYFKKRTATPCTPCPP